MTNPNAPAYPANLEGWSNGITVRELLVFTLLAGDAKSPCEECKGYMEQRARTAIAYADIVISALNKGEA